MLALRKGVPWILPMEAMFLVRRDGIVASSDVIIECGRCTDAIGLRLRSRTACSGAVADERPALLTASLQVSRYVSEIYRKCDGFSVAQKN
ncbi:hypothetical protein CCGE525_27800 (plasmid) [Rhizobium jaguaris]|uniref:Uncharacterized protein n=1 Tax=Rhizobium jaguaris TaxID=1312183 RepID=A0A387G3H1_9HYPH|nr:hypothetical protein CCGE525_27800 [Rhizobium jaguaris]